MSELFRTSSEMSHGYCLLWQKSLILLHIISNGLIALAYISIPIGIYLFIRHKTEIQHKSLAALSALFILSCAMTHIMGMVVVWYPLYYLQGIIMAVTALISIATAWRLWQLMPQLLKMPTAEALQQEIQRREYAEQSLRLSLEKSQQFFSQPLTGLAVISFERVLLQVNEHLCQMLGFSEQELLNREWSNLLDKDDIETEQQAFKQLLNDKVNGYELVARFQHKNQQPVWVKMVFRCIRNAEGNIEYFLLAANDISELKRIERNLIELNQNLEQRIREEVENNREKDHLLIQQSRLAAMGEMIGNIAHQWRQPINALGLLLANIADAYDYGELDKEYMQQQLVKGNRLIQNMSSTIDDFRNFFKPDSLPEVFDAKLVLNDALSIIEASLRNNNILISVAGEDNLKIKGLPGQYRQALLNILGNAKDALSERRVRQPEIAIVLHREQDNIALTIEDNAGGIAPEVMKKIFDPYFTTRQKGSGIGLYMTKMIIENSMKGQLTVRNTERGAEFKILIPSTLSDMA